MQHEKVIYLLQDTAANRKLIHRYLDVYEYPDGRIELRAEGVCVPYQRYDKLPLIDAAAIVENKRLGHALQAAMIIQSQRDDRRSSCTPSRTNQGKPPAHVKALAGTKRSRAFTAQDVELAVLVASTRRSPHPPPPMARKTGAP